MNIRLLPIVLILYLLSSIDLLAQNIFINEVQYSNDTSLYDCDGESVDWFELYNADSTSVNLQGYEVFDNSNGEGGWIFPEYVILPYQYFVVFASGKDIREGRELHTDFKLQMMKEALTLKDADGKIIDQTEIRCIPTDKSLGCKPDGVKERKILNPSPGYSNDHAKEYFLNYKRDSLQLNFKSGFYNHPIDLQFSTSDSASLIFYTLDGEIPDEHSLQYSKPVRLDDISANKNRFANKADTDFEPGSLIMKGNIVRAMVYSEGCPASNEVSNTYIINPNFQKEHSVPVISLITEKDNLFDNETGIYVYGNHNNYSQHGKNWERPVHIEVFEEDGKQIIDQDGGMRINGGGSRGANQKALRLYADKDYGKEYFEYPFFSQKPELKSFKTLLLRHTGDWSGTLFKDELCQYLVQDMDIDYSASQTSIVFINGEYWGLYSFRERQDMYYVENNFHVSDVEFDVIRYFRDNYSVDEGDDFSYSNLLQFIEDSDPEDREFYELISEKIDLKSLMDFYIAQLYLANSDFPDNNVKMWKLKNNTSKWRMFFFDMDAAMMKTSYNHLAEYNNESQLNVFPEYSTLLFRSLLSNDQFRTEFYVRFRELMHTNFSPENVLKKIEFFEELYEPLMNDHIYRWGNPSDMRKWKENVEMLKLFAEQRPLSIGQQLTENFGNPFNLYPNPSTGNINIDFSGNVNNIEIEIFNLQANLVFKIQLKNESFYPLDLNLDPGSYLLRLKTDETYFSEMLIVL